jgi:RHS repeat-associated protein
LVKVAISLGYRQTGKTPIKQGNNFGFDGDDPIDFEDADSTLHFFFPKDYAYAAADSVTDFSNRVSLRRYFYSDRGKDYMLVGVPWSWIDAAPEGDLIIDPTTNAATSVDVRLYDDNNYGNDTRLAIGKFPNASNYKTRTLIKFDLSGIASNATVLRATMNLKYFEAVNYGGGTWVDRWVQAHELLGLNFDEQWATRDDRTVDIPWYTPYAAIDGTDAKATMESTLLFWQSELSELPKWKSWDLTALTQKWLATPASNYGVILWATNEDVAGYTMRFYSSEAGNSSDRPNLEVVYSTEATTRTVYFLKDHLGSIRATVLDSAGAPVIGYDDYDPWGYPLALRTKAIPNAYLQGASKNKFTGKERDEEFGLNLDYFGARYYDGQIGRWFVRDPLAEKYPFLSPYVYVADNPIKFFDPDGKKIVIAGAPQFRQTVLANLQRLTNDKVSIRNDGTVVINKLNSEKLGKALTRGTNLVRTLNQKDPGAKTITIVETKVDNTTKPLGKEGLMVGGKKGAGADSEVQFNPNETKGGVDITGSTNRPTEIGLGHELLHAEHIAAGEADNSTANVTDPDSGLKGVLPNEEVRTRREENELRKEQGLKPRKDPK